MSLAFVLNLASGFSAAFECCVYVESFKSKIYVSSRSILHYFTRYKISAISAGG